jgi:hypothetical protein
VPVPFSNLGTIIDELFIPTMMVQDSYENHAKKARLSHEDRVKFRYESQLYYSMNECC